MKNTLLIIIVLFASHSLLARCGEHALWTYPKEEVISKNSYIVLETYAKSRNLIEGLNNEYPVYLLSADHRVNLEIVQINESLFNLSQAILRPVEQLREGSTYELKVDNYKGFRKQMKKKEDPISGEKLMPAWTVRSHIDRSPPEWIKQPALDTNTIQIFGCGPEVYAHFALQASDRSDILIRTELMNKMTKELQVFYLIYRPGRKLAIGHGMCAGAFYFEKKPEYKVRLRLMDICGNENPFPDDWIEIGNPYQKSR